MTGGVASSVGVVEDVSSISRGEQTGYLQLAALTSRALPDVIFKDALISAITVYDTRWHLLHNSEVCIAVKLPGPVWVFAIL